MKRTALVAAFAGLALFTAVVAWQGWETVTAGLAAAGWGLAGVALFHLIIVVLDAIAWRALFPPSAPIPGVGPLAVARWLGESINGLLPVAQIGGDVAKARLLARSVPAPIAAATVLADLTVAAGTQMLFGVLGLWLLVMRLGRSETTLILLAGLALAGLGIGVFYLLQRMGLFGRAARRVGHVLGNDRGAWLDGEAAAFDRALDAVYTRRGGVLRSAAWHFATWLLGAGEVWLLMALFGAPVTLLDALLLESLGQAVRGAAFLIPGGLGVQEGAYIFLASTLGLPPGLGLSLSLGKRVRELLLGLPGLVAWQFGEARLVVTE